MIDGRPSITAARVAARRLALDRAPWPPGDPTADERLATDVAGGLTVSLDDAAGRHVAERTRFVDAAVVGALVAGVRRALAVGAGYDGRSWRYAAPGVRWFEVDHPATQADKRARLDRLGIDSSDVTFVPADLVIDDLTAAVLDAGWRPEEPGLVVCEGVLPYLDIAVVATVLTRVRALAGRGSRFVVTFAIDDDDPARTARRAALDAAVARAGEPIRSRFPRRALDELLRSTGWRVGSPPFEPSPSAAGCLVAEPADG